MGDAGRGERIRHAAEERLARLEAGRRSGLLVAAAKRFVDIEGATYGGLLAIELFTTGTKGTTSAAPSLGCTPSCRLRSIRFAASATARNAASSTASGVPAKVTTLR